MSISAIGGCSPAAQTQASQYKSSATATRTVSATASNEQGAAFVSAIASTLQEIGVNATNVDDGSNSSNDAAQALGDFLGKLMDSMQAQARGPGGPPPTPAGADGTTETADTTELETSFTQLLDALGLDSSDSSSKLGQFIETLASKLESSGPAGNLVNTVA